MLFKFERPEQSKNHSFGVINNTFTMKSLILAQDER